MDKIIGLIAIICVGALATMFTLVVSGVMDYGNNKRQRNRDSDLSDCIPDGSGNRRCDKRCTEQEIKDMAKKLNVKLGDES